MLSLSSGREQGPSASLGTVGMTNVSVQYDERREPLKTHGACLDSAHLACLTFSL
jgi:hypothetical protein